MNQKKDCKIILDLLPNYVEKVTSKETNSYIEEHLKNCDECKKAYTSMTEDLNIQVNNEEKEIKYLKKFHKQLKVLKFIILIVVLFLVVSVGRKTIILYSIDHKLEETEKTFSNNYYAKQINYTDGSVLESTVFSKGTDHYISSVKLATVDGQTYKSVCYVNGEEKLSLADMGNKKLMKQNDFIGVNGYFWFASEEIPSYLYSKILSSFSLKIEDIKIGDKECYVIKHKDIDRIVDKETGILIKEIDYKQDRIIEWTYELGTVLDSDIVRPDTTGYIEE